MIWSPVAIDSDIYYKTLKMNKGFHMKMGKENWAKKTVGKTSKRVRILYIISINIF